MFNKKTLSNYSYVSSKKNCVKNTVNDAKFVNFNTVFLKKYHTAHHFSFKSSLAKLRGNKVKQFLSKTLVADFQNGSSKFKG